MEPLAQATSRNPQALSIAILRGSCPLPVLPSLSWTLFFGCSDYGNFNTTESPWGMAYSCRLSFHMNLSEFLEAVTVSGLFRRARESGGEQNKTI